MILFCSRSSSISETCTAVNVKKCIVAILSEKRQNGRRTCAAHLSTEFVVAQSGQRIMILYPQEALDHLGQLHGQLV